MLHLVLVAAAAGHLAQTATGQGAATVCQACGRAQKNPA
jgi:hypothetical protein